MKKFAILLVLPLALLVNACTSRIGANEYATAGTGQVNRAVKGTIVSVRQVQVQSDNGAGTLIGGAAGGVAGSMIGGGMAGDAAQGALSRQGGYEYVVQLDTGGLITVTQGTDVLLTPGQKCLVLYGKQARVVPYNGI